MQRIQAIIRKIMAATFYVFYLLAIVVFFDVIVFHDWMEFGYLAAREQEPSRARAPAPYVEFVGNPDNQENNKKGFRGKLFADASPGVLRIAFFGGSTGYRGNPPIPDIVERELAARLGEPVYVVNYSVEGSVHRQHLHALLEYLPRNKPDIVIFYGGYNEMIQSAAYDPRPGYPFDYYYRAETTPLQKLLLEHSALLGVLDKKTGLVSGRHKLIEKQKLWTPVWQDRIVDKYLETLQLANNVTGTLESGKFGHTRFLAFYQPFQVPDLFMEHHQQLREHLRQRSYVHDVSDVYQPIKDRCYVDIVHVNQECNEVMGARIAQDVAEVILSAMN